VEEPCVELAGSRSLRAEVIDAIPSARHNSVLPTKASESMKRRAVETLFPTDPVKRLFERQLVDGGEGQAKK
jgi:hypothetical protein